MIVGTSGVPLSATDLHWALSRVFCPVLLVLHPEQVVDLGGNVPPDVVLIESESVPRINAGRDWCGAIVGESAVAHVISQASKREE